MKIRLFGPNESEEVETGEEYIEINTMDSQNKTGRLGIVVEKLNDFADTERVLKSVRGGNIIFLKIKGLKEKDIGELKRAVEKLKKGVVANNGDIAGVEQEWLILAPEYVKVARSE